MRIILVVLLAFLSTDPREIAKINALKKEAESAYLAGNYELAASKYKWLTDSLGVEEDLVNLNLAHSYYHLGDTAGAKLNYGAVSQSADKKLRSIAFQQLGVMSKDIGKLEASLSQLKSAIKADPTNRDAIYDYEVVKKLLENQKNQENQDQNQDQENQENQDQENQEGEDQENQEGENQENQEGEQGENEEQEGENQENSEEEQQQGEGNEEQKEGEEQQEGEEQKENEEKAREQMTKEKLEEMGITEEKARQLLEAMRQSEIKYLQNQRRKPTKRPPSGKPDW